jgi:hypothetical protein
MLYWLICCAALGEGLYCKKGLLDQVWVGVQRQCLKASKGQSRFTLELGLDLR